MRESDLDAKRARALLEAAERDVEMKDVKIQAIKEQAMRAVLEIAAEAEATAKHERAERERAFKKLEEEHAAELEELDAALARATARADELRMRATRGYTVSGNRLYILFFRVLLHQN